MGIALYFYFLFLLHFRCAELGYLVFWMMQWVNKIMYQEGNLLRSKDLDTTFGFVLIKEVGFHAVESCAGGRLGAYTPSMSKGRGDTECKWRRGLWHLMLCLRFSTALGLDAHDPGSVTRRKSDVFTCEILNLLTLRERSGWLPGKRLIHSLNISVWKQPLCEPLGPIGTSSNCGRFSFLNKND